MGDTLKNKEVADETRRRPKRANPIADGFAFNSKHAKTQMNYLTYVNIWSWMQQQTKTHSRTQQQGQVRFILTALNW